MNLDGVVGRIGEARPLGDNDAVVEPAMLDDDDDDDDEELRALEDELSGLRLERLRELVKAVSSMPTYRMLQASARRRVRDQTAELINIIGEADVGEVNRWLLRLNLSRVLNAFMFQDDRRLFVETLLKHVPSMSVLSISVFIDALQKCDDIPPAQRSSMLAKLICSVHGASMRDLKMLLDHRGTYHNLVKLIYEDIAEESDREQILDHIKLQARLYSDNRCVKLLSDIDDTLFSSGGPPGGVDKAFPKHALYPGVIAFYLELLRGMGDPQSDSSITFLSARPTVYHGFSERATYRKLQHIWNDRRVPSPTPNLLPGDLRSSSPSLVGRMSGIARKKFENFVKYASVYPEARFIFVGDNGQGDVDAGVNMREQFPDRVVAVFIHRFLKVDAGVEAQHADDMISYFVTYVGAALSAFSFNMITAAGLRSIAQLAVRELVRLQNWATPLLRAQCIQDHMHDIALVNEFIVEEMVPGPIVEFPEQVVAFANEHLNSNVVADDDDDNEDFLDGDDEEDKEEEEGEADDGDDKDEDGQDDVINESN
jgi:Phosphatidate phosphatase APP1, catalytic domain